MYAHEGRATPVFCHTQKEAGQDVAVPLLLAAYREITSIRALAVNRQIPARVND